MRRHETPWNCCLSAQLGCRHWRADTRRAARGCSAALLRSAASRCGFAAPTLWTLGEVRRRCFERVREKGLSTFMHRLHAHYMCELLIVPTDPVDKLLFRAGDSWPTTKKNMYKLLPVGTQRRAPVQAFGACSWQAASEPGPGGSRESATSRDTFSALVAGVRVYSGLAHAPGPCNTA